MAKIVKTAAAKGRETKLSKKTAEELIQIILRKDKTEHNLSAQVSTLKGEVNTLTSRVNAFDKDMEGTLTEVRNLRDSNKTNRETIDSLRIELNDIKEAYNKECKYSVELENKVQTLTASLCVAIGIAVICTVCWIFF